MSQASIRAFWLLMIIAGAAVLGVMHALQQQGSGYFRQNGVILFPQPLPVQSFSFINQHGETVTQQHLQNRWKLVFFGYTHCPDICPTTLMNLSRVWKTLTEDTRHHWQVILVSVDPKRDTPDVLKPYMNYFHPDFWSLTGNDDALAKMAADLTAFYSRVKYDGGMTYLMDHSANIAILDKQWRYRGYIAPPFDRQRLLPMLERLDLPVH